MILSLPWIVLALLGYNAVIFLFNGGDAAAIQGGANPREYFERELFHLPMLSENSNWIFTLGDLILAVALIALFVEILKATRTRPLAILDHGLSVIVFIICLVEFLLVGEAATSLFFFITLISLIDVVAGFSVGIRAARRDFSFDSGG